jgi:cell division initiation protein
MSKNLQDFKFDVVKKGYDPKQVRDFVNLMIGEFERVVNHNNTLEDEIQTLLAKLMHFKEIEESLSRALIAAQIESTNIMKKASKEQEAILKSAELDAKGILNEAVDRVQEIEHEIQSLKQSAKRYKTRLRNIVESQLEMIGDVEEQIERIDRDMNPEENIIHQNEDGDISTDHYFQAS